MINIAEKLKDCPKGTKLYSPVCCMCELNFIKPSFINVIANGREYVFDYYGRFLDGDECLLFPSKDNRDWNTFNYFKNGDFVTYKYNGSLVAFIFKEFISSVLVKHHFALYIGNMGYTMDEEIMIRPDCLVIQSGSACALTFNPHSVPIKQVLSLLPFYLFVLFFEKLSEEATEFLVVVVLFLFVLVLATPYSIQHLNSPARD